MMKRILLAGLLGGIAAYVWGAISWSLLPWHNATLKELPNDSLVISAVRASRAETGTYYFPSMPSDAEFEALSESEQNAWLEEYQKGPSGLMIYYDTSRDPMSPLPFAGGLLIYIASALIAAFLLSHAVGTLRGYWGRVAFVAAIGLFAALVSHIGHLNWGFETLGYALSHAFDLVIGWGVAGTIIAWRLGGEK